MAQDRNLPFGKRLACKVAKLRRDPLRFLADSKGMGERLVEPRTLSRLNRGLDSHPAFVLGVPQELKASVALCFPKLRLEFLSSESPKSGAWPKRSLVLCWANADPTPAARLATERGLPFFLIEVDSDGDLMLVAGPPDEREARHLKWVRRIGEATFRLMRQS